ncbi:MAG: hypothetical protein IT497_07115, partial [Ottowia sp.]|nr:hypothetical protein [Ottowia sp.]
DSAVEALRIINTSKELGVVYGARASLINDEMDDSTHGVSLISGMQAIDFLLAKRGKKAPALSGFYFVGEEHTLAILVGLRTPKDIQDEEVCENTHVIECLVNPGSAQTLSTKGIPNFCVASKFTLPAGNAPVIFEAADLFPVIAALKPYPAEKEIYGVRASLALKMATVLSATVALSCSAWAGYQVWDSERQAAALTQYETQNATTQEAISTWMSKHPTQVAKTLSINETKIFALAESLWRPGTKMRIEATPTRAQYVLSLKLSQPTVLDMGRASVFSVTDEDTVQALLNVKPGKGCIANEYKTNGELSELRVHISCQISDPAVRAYLD